MSADRVFANILDGGWRDRTFEPFRPGIEICRLSEGQPTVALLRYAPGSTVPRHVHDGHETILVLEGSQSDGDGRYPAGTLVLNRPGSDHEVRSDDGCVVLIQWDRPVRFLQPD